MTLISHKPASVRWLLLAVVALFISSLSNSATAQMGPSPIIHLPALGVSKTSGLRVNVQPNQPAVNQFGYRTIEFEFCSLNPLTADTSITVCGYASEWSRNNISAEADLEMLTGQSTAIISLRVPQYNDWNIVFWDVWVDGKHDPELSLDRQQTIGLSRNQNGVTSDGTLTVWNANPTRIIQGLSFNPFTSRRERYGQTINTQHKKLSSEWLDYTCSDVVLVDLLVLAEELNRHPKSVAALRKWIATGGNLWVQNVGTDWGRLQQLNQLLAFSTADGDTTPIKPEGTAIFHPGEWTYVHITGRMTADRADGLAQDFAPAGDTSTGEGAKPKEIQPIYSEDWFAVRRLGWGTVGAYCQTWGHTPTRLHRESRGAVIAFWQQRAWTARHGLSPSEANGDFSNWLIPGVGMAPVIEFQVLITLFVLGIGPLNYWLLKRAGRLHLLVLTVPAAAILVTGGLLTYGMLSDGFGTRVRSQSITLLDQEQGEAVSWNRLSYYSSFAPRDGLTFSDNTAIYPILPGFNEDYATSGSKRQRSIVWTQDEQHLKSGWLASRTPTQYLTIEPHTTKAKLDIQEKNQSLRIVNHIGTSAQLLIMRDGDGQWHQAVDIAQDESRQLEPIGYPEVVSLLRKFLDERAPKLPDAIESSTDSSLYRDQRRRTRRQYLDEGQGYADSTASQSLLQRRWQELLGFEAGEPLNLPPRSYVLVSDKAAIVSIGMEAAREEASVHLLLGTW